ncbi:MAG TPA: GFA family protein [Labilithrix sp.]|nr:GFA family protein [Labilithrix sp.]
MTEPKLHKGGCHCKKVRYEVTIAADSAMGCNCSMCSKKGSLLSFVGVDAFRLKSGEDNLTDYQFNKHAIHHLFCKTCGVTSFARGNKPDGTAMVAVNVRCLDDFDLDAVTVKMVDGKAF